ncbi:MAG: pyrimidine dimer DNA glycosylase/endonuclease V [Fibrobacterota bacterium]
MRIWSLNPMYLDPQGLVALWRETLLAQAVLRNETKGYKNHPQLDRFKALISPDKAVSQYLTAVYDEAVKRGYAFDKSKIHRFTKKVTLTVTSGQLQYEWSHLMHKLETRNPEIYKQWYREKSITPHPMFTIIDGPVEVWEKV